MSQEPSASGFAEIHKAGLEAYVTAGAQCQAVRQQAVQKLEAETQASSKNIKIKFGKQVAILSCIPGTAFTKL